MNERLKELMLEAGYAAPEIAGRANNLAELIIQECIFVMKSTIDESIDFDRKLDETSYWIESDIKKHFGVEK